MTVPVLKVASGIILQNEAAARTRAAGGTGISALARGSHAVTHPLSLVTVYATGAQNLCHSFKVADPCLKVKQSLHRSVTQRESKNYSVETLRRLLEKRYCKSDILSVQ